MVGVDYEFGDANATPNLFITLWGLVNDSIEGIEDLIHLANIILKNYMIRR
jgi:hypothetical protein